MTTNRVSLCFLGVIVIGLLANASSPLQRGRRAVVDSAALLWPNKVIPYIVDSSFTGEDLRDLEYAISTWNNETCVTIRPYRQGDESWVRIQDGGNCESQYVGHSGVGGEQTLTLSTQGCRFYGLYLHELGHVLGLSHEHIRPDRDEFIKIHLNAVFGNAGEFFNKKRAEDLITYGSIYDLQSVMHYGPTAFAASWDIPVMEVKDPKNKELLRDVYKNVLSFWDAMVINRHYKCGSGCKQRSRCPNPGFVNKHCRCELPSEFAKRWCFDLQDTAECEKRASNEDCKYNAGYMAINCRKTCNVCYRDADTPNTILTPIPTETTKRPPIRPSLEACQTGDPKDGCPRYASECNSLEIYQRCPNVCNNCGHCKDALDRCAELVEHNYCTLHPQSMLYHCRKSCGACNA